ncbi:hypothetical protein MINTM020_01320 [Mycobacterium paraintracellulare]|uniref:hypothetical protein n=1 Tax=Mycobacterium paraintracellulare TaxID=1138383 RepID=UPI0019295639|nr:hypothetical protein [Mycobacterium paraintracellulare]BCP08034.1 hypothetical protein MINTM020_01320 [Mycobacterium paraintracellulare]
MEADVSLGAGWLSHHPRGELKVVNLTGFGLQVGGTRTAAAGTLALIANPSCLKRSGQGTDPGA